MSKLYFKIGADYDKVIRLRDEIAKLRRELLSMNMVANSSNFSALERQLNRTTQEFDRLIQQAATAATQMQNTTININHTTSSLSGMNSMLAKIGGTVALSKLASDIIRVRGEFQAADTAIQTLLGSKEKADALMKQVREYAKISPLEFSDVTAATQMMLGFNIEAEKVPRFISAIGDVSMGEAQKFNSLTLAFSQMSATGKLMGQDLNQMINAGFNPLQQIAQTTGKSIATLKEEMSKGAISTEMVQKAFIDATSAGGKFYQMSENASKTINGQLSMMQDAMDAAFNEMGQKSEGIIMSSIQLTTSLIENYETIGKVLVGMIATYGVYKTALITNIALTRSWAVAARADAVAKGIQAIATKAQTVAQLALNAAMKANPYVLAATLLVGAATAMWAFSDSTTAAERAQKKYNKTKADSLQKEEEHKSRLEDLIATIQNEYTSSMNRVKAIEAIKKEYPSLFQKYIDEKGHIKDLIGLWKEYNEEVTKNKVETNKKNLSDSTAKIEEYEKMLSLWKKLGENPYYRKKRLSKEEFELAEKYKGETESSLRRKLELAKPSRDLYQKEVRSDELAQWQLDLKKSTDIQIKTELEEMKRLQQARKNNKRYSLNVGIGSMKGSTTESELANRIDVLQSEYDSRNKTTYKVDYEKAKKEWNEAQKALSEIEKDKSKFTSKQYEDAKKRSETTEKAYKDLGGVTGSALTKQESAAEKRKKEAEKLRKEQEKYKLLTDKQNREEIRMEIDAQHEKEQIEINGLQESSEKVLRQRVLNHKKELEAIKREAEDKKLKEIEKAQSAFKANPDNKGKSFDVDEFIKSEPVKKQFTSFDKIADAKTKTENTKYNRGDDLSDLLNQYQDYTDQRLAIETKFNKDIATLQEQRKQAVKNGDTEQVEQIDRSIAQATKNKGMELMGLDYDKLKESPEYVRAFENLKETSSETLNSLLTQLENAKQTAAQVLSPDQLREYTTTIQEIMDELDSRNPFQALADRQKELAEAEEALAKAKAQLDAVNSGAKIVTGVKNSKYNDKTGKIESEQTYLSATQALVNYNKAKDKAVKADAKVQAAEKKVSNVIDDLSNSIKNVGSSVGGQAGEIIGLIGDIGTFAMSAMSGIETASQTASAAVKAVESASVILMIISTAIQIATKISNMFSKDKEKEMEKYVGQLNAMIDIYERIIEKQKESIRFGYGFSAITSAKKAMEELNNKTEQYRKIAQSAGASKDSLSRDYRDRFLEMLHDVKPISFNLKPSSLKSLDTGDLSKFTAKQLLYFRDNYKDIWSALNEEQRNALQAIIDAEEESKEIVDAWKESITGISYDNLYSEFIDTLSDMDSSAEDMANNFGEYLRKSILASMVANEFQDKIDNLYEMWVNAGDEKSEGGTNITEDEAKKIQERQKELAEAMTKRREEIEKTYDFDSSTSSQESTKKGFAAASQDSIDELNGRFTALQIAGEEIKNQNIIQSQSLNILTVKADSILSVNTDTRNIADEIRTIQVNSFLELQEIRENTGAIIKPIKDMAADIAEVKKNTSKL